MSRKLRGAEAVPSGERNITRGVMFLGYWTDLHLINGCLNAPSRSANSCFFKDPGWQCEKCRFDYFAERLLVYMWTIERFYVGTEIPFTFNDNFFNYLFAFTSIRGNEARMPAALRRGILNDFHCLSKALDVGTPNCRAQRCY